jgi:hypothetical protein
MAINTASTPWSKPSANMPAAAASEAAPIST